MQSEASTVDDNLESLPKSDARRSARSARRSWPTSRRATSRPCIRFKRLDEVPLAVVSEAIAGTSVEDFISSYERSRS